MIESGGCFQTFHCNINSTALIANCIVVILTWAYCDCGIVIESNKTITLLRLFNNHRQSTERNRRLYIGTESSIQYHKRHAKLLTINTISYIKDHTQNRTVMFTIPHLLSCQE